MKKLILAEKPSVAKEIARVLGCNKNVNGAIVGPQYVVTWALGHLVTLATPEEMNHEWQEWKIETLPMIPKKFETRVISGTSKQFNNVKTWLKSDEISELIIATDAGREGELVARFIINKVGFNKPMQRLWISSMTDKAIKEGFNNLLPARRYEPLYHSALSRAIADWLVGLNVTRALTCKYNAQLSAGRVQTPTLAMIVEREEEINHFIPKEYSVITTKIKGTEFTLQNNNADYHIFDKVELQKIMNELPKYSVKVKKVTTNTKHELPPLLYDLTTLQQDGNRLYGLTAKQTLDIIQKLYEHYKYLTYPRTDSKYLSLDMYDTIKERLLTITDQTYKPFVNKVLSKPLNKSKKIFDNTKVSDHHAIILTEQRTNLMLLDNNEKRIYDLVMKRLLSAFMDDYIYNHLTIILEIGPYTFKACGKKIISLGWKELYKQGEIEDENLSIVPVFTEGEPFEKVSYNLQKGLTKPKDRYTEATLLYAMEHCGNMVEGSMQKVLNSVSGIGTPATRADIIERIFSAGYVELKGKSIFPTEKGKQLIKIVPPSLKSPSLTALWELKLSKIEKGLMNKDVFIKEMEDNTKALINEVLEQEFKYRHDNASLKKCPNCGKTLLEVNNKVGKALVCIDRNCGYKKYLSRNTNFMCPNCKRKLTEIESKEKLVLICSCGYKESKESYLKKLNENKEKLNKNALKTYMKKQEKEIPTNNPFATLFDEINK